MSEVQVGSIVKFREVNSATDRLTNYEVHLIVTQLSPVELNHSGSPHHIATLSDGDQVILWTTPNRDGTFTATSSEANDWGEPIASWRYQVVA